jgi:hypothetical protein
VSGIWLQE